MRGHCGIVSGEKGAVLYHKENLIGKSPREIFRLGVHLGFVPEDRLGMGLVASMGMVGNMMLKTYDQNKGRSSIRSPRGHRRKIWSSGCRL